MAKRPRGNPRLDEVRNRDTTAATAARSKAAEQRAKDLYWTVADAYGEGCKTYGEIARWLNKKGQKTPRGKAWTHVAVRRV